MPDMNGMDRRVMRVQTIITPKPEVTPKAYPVELAHAPNIAQYITAAAPAVRAVCPVTANGMVTHHGHRLAMPGTRHPAKVAIPVQIIIGPRQTAIPKA